VPSELALALDGKTPESVHCYPPGTFSANATIEGSGPYVVSGKRVERGTLLRDLELWQERENRSGEQPR
jgi:hypothetical protein